MAEAGAPCAIPNPISVWIGCVTCPGCGKGACGATVPCVAVGEAGLAACISAAVLRRRLPGAGCSEGEAGWAVGGAVAKPCAA